MSPGQARRLETFYFFDVLGATGRLGRHRPPGADREPTLGQLGAGRRASPLRWATKGATRRAKFAYGAPKAPTATSVATCAAGAPPSQTQRRRARFTRPLAIWGIVRPSMASWASASRRGATSIWRSDPCRARPRMHIKDLNLDYRDMLPDRPISPTHLHPTKRTSGIPGTGTVYNAPRTASQHSGFFAHSEIIFP